MEEIVTDRGETSVAHAAWPGGKGGAKIKSRYQASPPPKFLLPGPRGGLVALFGCSNHKGHKLATLMIHEIHCAAAAYARPHTGFTADGEVSAGANAEIWPQYSAMAVFHVVRPGRNPLHLPRFSA